MQAGKSMITYNHMMYPHLDIYLSLSLFFSTLLYSSCVLINMHHITMDDDLFSYVSLSWPPSFPRSLFLSALLYSFCVLLNMHYIIINDDLINDDLTFCVLINLYHMTIDDDLFSLWPSSIPLSVHLTSLFFLCTDKHATYYHQQQRPILPRYGIEYDRRYHSDLEAGWYWRIVCWLLCKYHT